MTRSTPGPLVRARRFAFFASLALVLSACSLLSGGDDDESLPLTDYVKTSPSELGSKSVLRLGEVVFPTNLNPVHVDGILAEAPKLLEPSMGSAVRVLADGRWEVNQDYAKSVSVVDAKPLTIEVVLEPQAVWQGGASITSADMVAFVKAMKDNRYQASGHPAINDIDKVVEKSKFTYHVVFKRVNADWPAVIYPTLPAAVTAKPEIFNTAYTTRAIPSNGPFVVTKIDPTTNTLRLDRNPLWWGKKPALKTIEWRFAESGVLKQAFELGEIDVAHLEKADAKNPPAGGVVRVSASTSWTQITLNGGRGALADAKVRQAVSLAINRTEFAEGLKTTVGHVGREMDTVVLMPGQTGHQPLGVKQDVAKAKSLLKEAGWNVGDKQTTKKGQQMTLTLPIPKGHASSQARAKLIASQLKQIGIAVNVQEVPANTFHSRRVIPLDFDLVTFTRTGSAFNLTPSRSWFTPLDSPDNFTGKASKAISQAFDTAIRTLDEDKRVDAIHQIGIVANNQASIVPLAVVPNALVVRDGVVNFGPTQFEDIDWTLVGWDQKSSEK